MQRVATRRHAAWPIAAAWIALVCHSAAATELDAVTRDGQRLFQIGQSTGGLELAATLAQGTVRLGGTAAACARCHGSDGDGAHEAGLATPPLAWHRLAQPRAAGAGLPERPAYDDAALLRALRHGIDAAGRPLNAAMPRFDLNAGQEAALLGYLRVVGGDDDLAPGVSNDTVRVALVGDGSGMSQAVQQAALACLREANARAGVFGRRIEWTQWDTAALSVAGTWQQLTAQSALVVAPWWPDAGRFTAFAQFAHREKLAIVGPVPPTAADAPSVFHVAPDPRDALRVIVDHLAARPAQHAGPVLVRAPHGIPGRQEDLALLRERAERYPKLRLIDVTLDPTRDLAALVARHRPTAVIDLGDAAELQRTDAALAQAGLPDGTQIYALYARLGRAAFALSPRARQRLALAHAHPLGAEAAPTRMLTLLQLHGTAVSQPASQAVGYVAGCVALEALMRTGRRITRDRLSRAIESISRFETGVLPPLSFGPRQRHGVWGARIVRIEGDGLVAQTGWLTPTEP